MSDHHSEEITLRDIILTGKSYVSEIYKNWLIVALITVPFVIWFGYKAMTSPINFQATTKFYMEGANSGGSSLGGLLGQFGFGSGGGDTNPLQIVEVGNSKLLLSEILFERIEPNNKFLANEIIDLYKLDEVLAESFPRLKGFRFSDGDIDSFSRDEKIALKLLYRTVINGLKDIKPLRSFMFEEDKGFYQISSTSISSYVALALNSLTYEKVRFFYEEKAVEGLIETRDLLKKKADSLKTLVEHKMYSLNRFGDQSRDLVSLEVGTKRDILQREITGISVAQMEAVKQYELADFELQTTRNRFMLIEKPFDPLSPQGHDLVFEVIKAIILGLLLSFGFIIARKIYRDALQE